MITLFHWTRFFIKISLFHLHVQGHWKTRFDITSNGFIGIRQQNGNKTFFPANITLCRFLLAANTVQVFSAFQTLVCLITSKPFVSLLCLSVWDRLQSAFPESTSLFGHLPSACGEQNCNLVQPTTYFPAFHVACWQSFLSLQNRFLCSGSAFSRRKQKPFGKKIFWKVPLYLTASIPDLSAFPCERAAILLLSDISGQACFVTFTGLCFSGASPHLGSFPAGQLVQKHSQPFCTVAFI